MEKFIVKYKDGEKVYGEYSSRKEASDKLMEHIHNFNKYFEGEYLSPFDFVLEVVECKEVNEVITDFETARILLFGNDTFDNYQVSARRYNNILIPLAHLERLVNETNKKHIVALIALNRLFTIAEAWNKADGFVPDFSDLEQYKYYPLFVYDKVDAKFKFSKSMSTYVSANFGSRICFKTGERAEQFGKQFEYLFNKVLM